MALIPLLLTLHVCCWHPTRVPLAGLRKSKDGKLSGEKSKQDENIDADEAAKGTSVGPSGDNEKFKSQGRDTQGKGDTLGIGDKKGQNT